MNRHERRKLLAQHKIRTKTFNKPDIPWYLISALETGDVDRVELALKRAFSQGYEPEYIAKKIGVDEQEISAYGFDRTN